MDLIIASILSVLGGILLGGLTRFFIRYLLLGKRRRETDAKASAILTAAEAKRKEVLLEAKEEALKTRNAAEAEYRERRNELRGQERRFNQKEESLERKVEALEQKQLNLSGKEEKLESKLAQAEELKEQQLQQLETIANLSVEEAKEQLISEAQEGIQGEIDRRTYELELRMNEEAEVKARKAIALAIQRLTSDVVSETTTSVVPLPSDDMKGRLIGREGRNIRALERATGVDLIIDDTPEAVTLSTFDPVRREIARVAVTKLVSDGRIHPARIEDIVAKSKIEVEENIKTAGQEAMYELGITGFHPDLVKLVGQLKYRYSYGHNILRHSIEVAFLAALMAGEIGANVDITKKAALLHDIGKAVTHEVQGGHAEIGAEIARKYNIRSEVVEAVEEHHNEDRVNVEAFLVAAADAISGARPGARRDSVEHYVKRLRALEDVATSYDGVEKAYAIQAGREIRIMVKPQQVDDIGAARLAREVVKKIEKELVYPGEIKVTVVRETRALGTAR
ncbi:MAG: ribonuclease Y [Chloroflexi bacterium]|nr:ribonuclease Y [Chloroflexota bacterium]